MLKMGKRLYLFLLTLMFLSVVTVSIARVVGLEQFITVVKSTGNFWLTVVKLPSETVPLNSEV